MNGNRNGSSLRERRQGDSEMQELRREMDEMRDSFNALRADLKEMMLDYNTGVGVLRWVKWMAAIAGGVAGAWATWRGFKV